MKPIVWKLLPLAPHKYISYIIIHFDMNNASKKAIRQLILIGRDRETAKLLQQAERMLNQSYQEGETTTDRFWKLQEWMHKKGKYMVNKYDCPNDCLDLLVTRLFNEGFVKANDEPMTEEIEDTINRLSTLIQR